MLFFCAELKPFRRIQYQRVDGITRLLFAQLKLMLYCVYQFGLTECKIVNKCDFLCSYILTVLQYCVRRRLVLNKTSRCVWLGTCDNNDAFATCHFQKCGSGSCSEEGRVSG